MIELHLHKLNGSTTNPFVHKSRLVKLYSVYSMTASNYWCSTENSTNNAWNLNFNSGNLNNNNNKYNSNNLRAVAALSDQLYTVRVSENSFIGTNIQQQAGNRGPDTTMRLFNLL